MLHGHGGDVYSLSRELGLSPEKLLDFSSNISPLPFPAGLREILIHHLDEIRFLPEVDSFGLRQALSKRYGMSEEQFLIGSGTTEWIFSLPRIIQPEKVVVPLPTYADYQDSALQAGCNIKLLEAWHGRGQGGEVELLDLLSKEAQGNNLIFLCNPNNPTGQFIDTSDLRDLISNTPQTLWVIDESYGPFVAEDSVSSLVGASMPENLVVLRSFSKIYAIPGLRLGCAVGSRKIIELLSQEAKPWAVNRMAQVAGEFLIGQTAYEEEVRAFCSREKAWFLKEIKDLRWLEPEQGSTHFILFRVNLPFTAEKVCTLLRKQGLLIRNCANFKGLYGEYIRISIKDRDSNQRLISALRALESTTHE